jgi:hypothetical protein
MKRMTEKLNQKHKTLIVVAHLSVPKRMTKRTDYKSIGMISENKDASYWIGFNPNTHGFASNRFDNRAEALKFVKQLKDFSAEKVEVGGVLDEPWRMQSEGGPYADTLYVTIPKSKELEFVSKYGRLSDEFGKKSESKKLVTYRMWWD